VVQIDQLDEREGIDEEEEEEGEEEDEDEDDEDEEEDEEEKMSISDFSNDEEFHQYQAVSVATDPWTYFENRLLERSQRKQAAKHLIQS